VIKHGLGKGYLPARSGAPVPLVAEILNLTALQLLDNPGRTEEIFLSDGKSLALQ